MSEYKDVVPTFGIAKKDGSKVFVRMSGETSEPYGLFKVSVMAVAGDESSSFSAYPEHKDNEVNILACEEVFVLALDEYNAEAQAKCLIKRGDPGVWAERAIFFCKAVRVPFGIRGWGNNKF